MFGGLTFAGPLWHCLEAERSSASKTDRQTARAADTRADTTKGGFGGNKRKETKEEKKKGENGLRGENKVREGNVPERKERARRRIGAKLLTRRRRVQTEQYPQEKGDICLSLAEMFA